MGHESLPLMYAPQLSCQSRALGWKDIVFSSYGECRTMYQRIPGSWLKKVYALAKPVVECMLVGLQTWRTTGRRPRAVGELKKTLSKLMKELPEPKTVNSVTLVPEN